MWLGPKLPGWRNCPVVLGSPVLGPPNLAFSHGTGCISPRLNIRGKLEKKKKSKICSFSSLELWGFKTHGVPFTVPAFPLPFLLENELTWFRPGKPKAVQHPWHHSLINWTGLKGTSDQMDSLACICFFVCLFYFAIIREPRTLTKWAGIWSWIFSYQR